MSFHQLLLYLTVGSSCHSVSVRRCGVGHGVAGQGEVMSDNMSGAYKVSGQPSATGLPPLFNFKDHDDSDSDEGQGDLNEDIPPNEEEAEDGEAEPQPSTSQGLKARKARQAVQRKRPCPPRGSPPPPNGNNYSFVKGKQPNSMKYKPIGGRYSLGVTYSFDKQKPRSREDEPKVYYLRCSYQGNKLKGDKKRHACKARACITSTRDQLGNVSHNLDIPAFADEHSCMPKGAQAREIEIEVEDMRAKIYERAALNPKEFPSVSPDAV